MKSLSPFSTWSLKTKFALCSGVLMFVFSTLFTSWTLRLVESDIRTSVLDAQKALVRSTASDINDKIELRRDALATIAGLLSQAGPGSDAELDAFFRPRPVLQKMFDAVLVVDASGRVVHDLPHGIKGEVTGPSVADRPFFHRITGGEPMVIASPEKARTNGENFIIFAAPLRAKDGGVKGALLCALYLAHPNFLGNLGLVHIGRGGYFTVIERGEPPRFVYHPRQELISSRVPGGPANPVMAQMASGTVGTVEAVSQFGVQTLRTFTPLQTVPWVLVSVYPTAEAFAGLRSRQREVIWVGGALFVMASALAWLISSWLLRPLAGLRELMDRHAQDPGLPIPPERFGSAEVAALVTAYNAQARSRREFEERLRASEKSLERLVRLDALTGLFNRYQFNEEFPVALARSARSGLALALMFLDIDHFKEVNDTWGHAAGDLVLKDFADRLKFSVRQTDLVARLAGDEFVVVLEGLRHPDEATSLAAKILNAINKPFQVDGHALSVTSSMGIALNLTTAEPDARDLLARADAALYQAKAAGRNRFHVWQVEVQQ